MQEKLKKIFASYDPSHPLTSEALGWGYRNLHHRTRSSLLKLLSVAVYRVIQSKTPSPGAPHYSHVHPCFVCHSADKDLVQKDWNKEAFEEYKAILREGKAQGLWAFQGKTGTLLGLPAMDKGYIYINPRALEDMVDNLTQFQPPLVLADELSSSRHRGWFAYPDMMNSFPLQLRVYRAWRDGALECMHDAGTLHVREKGKVMPQGEALVRELLRQDPKLRDFRVIEGRDPFDLMFPTVKKELLQANLYDDVTYKEYVDREKTLLRQIKEATRGLKEVRRVLALVKELGGHEQLIQQMGEDLVTQLVTHSLFWLVDKDAAGEPSGLAKLADDYHSGRLSITIKE